MAFGIFCAQNHTLGQCPDDGAQVSGLRHDGLEFNFGAHQAVDKVDTLRGAENSISLSSTLPEALFDENYADAVRSVFDNR